MKMVINIDNVDSHALEYIIDLIEKNFKDNEGNTIRGGSLFREVWTLKNLLEQEIYVARNMEELDARRRMRGKVGVE